MRKAMKNAEVGDDGYQEDPTVNRLEELAAKKMGKEAALFVSSGTMGNLVAILTHCQRGEEIILELGTHIYYAEVGGISALAGVIPRLVVGNKGVHSPQDIDKFLRDEKFYYHKKVLICLENTHLQEGGIVIPPNVIEEICQLAYKWNIKVHLDGARIFNAAVALNIKPTVFTKNVDSVMFCLSKGLSAPVGSILAGSKEFIQKSRKNRKMLGGGMRQAGILAAAGIVAIEQMVERLKEDHKNARILGEGLADINKIKIDLTTVQTNIVHFDIQESGMDTNQFLSKLAKYNILGKPCSPTEVRFYTYYGIIEEDIYATVAAIREIVNEKTG